PRGRATEVLVVAGALEGKRPPSPPPQSWAARPDTDVAIWCIRMQPGATWTLPPAALADTVRTLYFFRGAGMRIGGEALTPKTAAVVRSDRPVELAAGDAEC